jgi:hypothetical protein
MPIVLAALTEAGSNPTRGVDVCPVFVYYGRHRLITCPGSLSYRMSTQLQNFKSISELEQA